MLTSHRTLTQSGRSQVGGSLIWVGGLDLETWSYTGMEYFPQWQLSAQIPEIIRNLICSKELAKADLSHYYYFPLRLRQPKQKKSDLRTKAIIKGCTKHMPSLNMDDLLLCISEITSYLPKISKTLGQISGCMVNMQKHEVSNKWQEWLQIKRPYVKVCHSALLSYKLYIIEFAANPMHQMSIFTYNLCNVKVSCQLTNMDKKGWRSKAIGQKRKQ